MSYYVYLHHNTVLFIVTAHLVQWRQSARVPAQREFLPETIVICLSITRDNSLFQSVSL